MITNMGPFHSPFLSKSET